jgi:N-acylneuraminate cytidylyltransferase
VRPRRLITLRPAGPEDALALWRWRNDPETRRASFEQAEIPLARHRQWLDETLRRPDRRLYIVQAGGGDAGVVRLDIGEQGEATVSLNLAPDWRGRGVGSAALRAAAAEAFGALGLRRLRAEVKTDNRASRRAFERARFAPVDETSGALTLALSAPGARRGARSALADRRLCIIPARGGSKRFPRKNLAPFDGTPLVVRAVQVAAEAGVFARIVVSTDDPEITLLAKRAGAEVRDRPAALAADSVHVARVCEAVLDQMEAEGERFAAFCVLVPTSPFRTAHHVRESLELLERRHANGVMSVSVFPHEPRWAVREVRGFLRLLGGAESLSRPLTPAYRHNGVVLWMRTAAFRRHGEFYCPRLVPYRMTLEDSVDVDHPIDLEFAEFLRRRPAR